MKRRCRSCKKFMKSDWHHNECRGCRRIKKQEQKPRLSMTVKFKPNKEFRQVIIDSAKPKSKTCEVCAKPGKLSIVKKFTSDGKILRDQTKACEKCRGGFLKRLGYT